MRSRIWNELAQIKYNQFYCVYLLARQKRWLNYFNIATLVFSSAGVMGWAIWKSFPIASCIVISAMQLMKLLQVHIIPSDKQIEKLDNVCDFYFDYFNNIEQLWHGQDRFSEQELQDKYFEIKKTEKEANKILKDVLKTVVKSIDKRANSETNKFLANNFNLQIQ